MKFLSHFSYRVQLPYRLQLLMDSDVASWLLVYAVTACSLVVSFLLLLSPDYFPI